MMSLACTVDFRAINKTATHQNAALCEPRLTIILRAARLAGESHVQIVGPAHDLARPRLRLDVVLGDAHQAEEHDRHHHLCSCVSQSHSAEYSMHARREAQYL